jgi:hypothetical protein
MIAEDQMRVTMSRRPSSRAGLNAALVLLAVLLAAVTITALLLVPRARTVPPSLEPAPAPVSFNLTAEETTDSKRVVLALELAPAGQLVAPAGGVLTASQCAPGAQLVSGSAPLAVNGVGWLALHTAVPLWRDLNRSSNGADVAALQTELTRLGHQLTISGRFDQATLAALRAQARLAGVPEPGDGLARSAVLWLPGPEIRLISCAFSLGQEISPGAVLATSTAELIAVRIQGDRSRDLPGARQLQVGEVTVKLDDNGAVTDPVDRQALAQTAAVAAHLLDPNLAVEGQLTLIEPVLVYPVPPAAVVPQSQTTGCVQAIGGPAWPVEIASSSLGRTYLRFADSAPAQISLQPAPDLTCS